MSARRRVQGVGSHVHRGHDRALSPRRDSIRQHATLPPAPPSMSTTLSVTARAADGRSAALTAHSATSACSLDGEISRIGLQSRFTGRTRGGDDHINHLVLALVCRAALQGAPAVVTTTSTILCLQRYRKTSRAPEEMRFDVKPRKILQRAVLLNSGSATSAGQPSGTASSLSRHRICSTFTLKLTGSGGLPCHVLTPLLGSPPARRCR